MNKNLIKLKKILISKEISDEYIGTVILTKEEFDNYKNSSFSNINILSRGYLNFDIEYGLIDPKKRIRKNAKGENIIFNIINTYPSWSEYPKRNNSLFMSTGYIIIGHDLLYHIYPSKNAKIAVCPTADLNSFYSPWKQFNKILDMFLYVENKSITYFMKLISGIDNNISKYFIYNDKNNNILNNSIDMQLENFYKRNSKEFPIKIIDYINKEINTYGNYVNWFDKKLFNPEINNFKLLSSNDKIPNGDFEVWTDGTCLLEQINKIGDTN
jgi:hypothetical protein